jgi:hypothetical protein
MKIVLVIFLLFNSCYTLTTHLKEGESKESHYKLFHYGSNEIYSEEICAENQVILSVTHTMTVLDFYFFVFSLLLYQPLLIKVDCGMELVL